MIIGSSKTKFSSGTTGNPKGIVHTSKSILTSAITFNNHNNLKKDTVMAHFFSMSYMAGILNTLISPFVVGGKIVLFAKFNSLTPLNFWERIKNNSVNTIWLSPTMLSMLLSIDRYKYTRKYCQEKIKAIFVGTAPLSEELKIQAQNKLTKKIFESYGLSELLIISSQNKKNYKNFSCGKTLNNVKISLSKKKEILIKTPSSFFGYLNLQSG